MLFIYTVLRMPRNLSVFFSLISEHSASESKINGRGSSRWYKIPYGFVND